MKLIIEFLVYDDCLYFILSIKRDCIDKSIAIVGFEHYVVIFKVFTCILFPRERKKSVLHSALCSATCRTNTTIIVFFKSLHKCGCVSVRRQNINKRIINIVLFVQSISKITYRVADVIVVGGEFSVVIYGSLYLIRLKDDILDFFLMTSLFINTRKDYAIAFQTSCAIHHRSHRVYRFAFIVIISFNVIHNRISKIKKDWFRMSPLDIHTR